MATTKKNKIIQFFTVKELRLALCEDGTVFSFETAFETIMRDGARTQVEKIVWKLRPEYMYPHE